MTIALRRSCYAALLSTLFCASAGAADAPLHAIPVEPGTTVQVEITPVTVEPILKPRSGPDARHCLRLRTYTAIIRCAEKYL